MHLFCAKRGCFSFSARKLWSSTSRAGFIAKIPFSVSQLNNIRIAAICYLIVAGERSSLSMYAAT
jgi:hypothetical protein